MREVVWQMLQAEASVRFMRLWVFAANRLWVRDRSIKELRESRSNLAVRMSHVNGIAIASEIAHH